MEKITGASCNKPVENIDVANLLPRTDLIGLVIVEIEA